MKFLPTKFDTAWLIEPDRHVDERGFFARTWCRREFEDHGINSDSVQCNVSFNRRKGTLRGMHFQAEPHQEAKLVRCTQGAIYDVIIDLRNGSRTFGEWQGVELTAANRNSLFVPEGFAHGFQTLEDSTEISYQMSDYFQPESARGIHFSDRTIGIVWPLAASVISERDASLGDFTSLFPEPAIRRAG